MDNEELRRRFESLSTANVTDGCLRASVAVRCAPSALQCAVPGLRIAGRVRPARHIGSVDIFLEAFEGADFGDVLVVDNGGRLDESCVGDLMALETSAAGLQGIVIWGLHRDTMDMQSIGLPVFSLGRLSTGPLHFGERLPGDLDHARVGDWIVDANDFVLGDEDGVIFIPEAQADEILGHAEAIRATESAQADRVRGGTTLREQMKFGAYLEAREANPALTFREHLRGVGGEIEV